MKDFELTKPAFKALKKLEKSDNKLASRIKNTILLLREDKLEGEALQGYTNFKKIRVGRFRIIHTMIDDILIITIIEKRETVYKTFEHFFKHSDFLK